MFGPYREFPAPSCFRPFLYIDGFLQQPENKAQHTKGETATNKNHQDSIRKKQRELKYLGTLIPKNGPENVGTRCFCEV